jgi:hypothetical protein
VYFEDASHAVLVEVKSIRSSYPDWLRGIYQCVKYRAVMEAQSWNQFGIRVFLVSEEELPSDLISLAQRLDVSLKVVHVN